MLLRVFVHRGEKRLFPFIMHEKVWGKKSLILESHWVGILCQNAL